MNVNVLEMIEDYMDAGMSEENASQAVLYYADPDAYAEDLKESQDW